MQAFLKGGTLSSGSKDKSEKPSTSTGKPKKLIPWVEKYRPRTVDDVAHQDEVVAVLKRSLQNQDLPNLLFYGPPGTGKTSTILAAARELYSADIFKNRVLELNASDERGINVVREKVKNFAQQTASGTRPDGKPCPPFKIIILDEADSMTHAAQAALRRTMEKESKTTRFCLICNYVSRIIEPLTSRCAKFRFKPLARDILEKRLREISHKENLTCEDGAIVALLDTSEGDMRKAITSLQSVARLKGTEEAITEGDVYEIAGQIPAELIIGLVKVCHSDSYEKLEQYVKDIILEGHSGYQIITQLHDVLLTNDNLNDKQKSIIMERLAIVDKRLMDGADEYLQIMDLCTVIMTQICHGNN